MGFLVYYVEERAQLKGITVASSPEANLISSILRDRDMPVALQHGVSENMFRAYHDEWLFMEEYYARHRKVPSKGAFRSKFPDFRIKAVDDSGYFADEVRKDYARHLLLASVRECTDHLAKQDLDAAVSVMQKSVVSIAANMGMTNDSDILSDWQSVYDSAMQRVKRFEENGAAGIPTGFDTLDEYTGGWMPGDLNIFAARLGEAKSWRLQWSATTAVAHGYTVQFNALEQTRSQVAMRIHAFMSGAVGKYVFDSQSLMQGRDYDTKEYKRFLKDVAGNAKGKLHVSDASRGRVSTMSIAAQIERNKPDVVFIDYLQIMKKGGGEWQDYAALSAELVALGTEYDVPIVGASQLNRNAAQGTGNSGPENLSGSDSFGQDASIIVTGRQISRSVLQDELVKNRNGAGGAKWYTHFDPSRGIMKPIDYDRAMDLRDRDRAEKDKGVSPKKKTKSKVQPEEDTAQTGRAVKRMKKVKA